MATDKAITYLKNKAPKGEFLAYINKKEAAMLKKAGGSGELVNGIPSFRPQDMGNKANQKSSAASTGSSNKSRNTGTSTRHNPHTSSGTSKTSTVSGNTMRSSAKDFVQTLNNNNAIAANRGGTKFTPYSGGSRPKGGFKEGIASLMGKFNPLSLIAGLMGGPLAGLAMRGITGLKGGFKGFNEKMRGINPLTGEANTQEEYEQARFDRQQTNRLDKLYAAKDKGYNSLFGMKTTDFTPGQQSKIDMLEQNYDPTTARNVLTGRDLGLRNTLANNNQTQMMPKAKPIFSDPFRNTVGTTTQVNASGNTQPQSSNIRDYSGIEDYGVDINPQGIPKSIFESLYPEGNLQEIIANSKTQKDYNINATKDLVENLPGGVVKEYFAPALAGALSPFYDGIQGIYRGAKDPNKSILQALKDENIGSSMVERFTGAAAPLAERFANFNNPFITNAAAGEMLPTTTTTEDITVDGGLLNNGSFMESQISPRVIAAENAYYNQGKMPPEFLGDRLRMNMELGNARGFMGPGFAQGGLASMFTRRR